LAFRPPTLIFEPAFYRGMARKFGSRHLHVRRSIPRPSGGECSKTGDGDNDEWGLKALAKFIGGGRISARITIFARLLRLT